MRKTIKIAQIAAEVEPFSKSGGLANVIGSLSRTQRELGHEVVIITPYYGGAFQLNGQILEVVAENEAIEVTAGIFEKATYHRGKLPGSDIPVYFISHQNYFKGQAEYGAKLYGSKNDNEQYLFFDVAALHLLKMIDWKPDIIHCHDWHTGLIPYFLKGRYKKDEFWSDSACLFTIHNLVYQLGHDWWVIPESDRDTGRTALPPFSDSVKIEQINFVKRAIMNADAVNTVSETYRDEILTKDFGEDLHRILKNREKMIFGIVNGIDYSEYNPLTDPGLYQHYSDKSVGRKKDNKLRLQKHYGLKTGGNTPLICMTSRIVEQKGFMLLIEIIPVLMALGLQMIIMGDGDEGISASLHQLQKQFSKQLVVTPIDRVWETSLYAGSDFFLLPSRYEPCGVNQLIALRYGCIPIVHHIGGLADTVVDFEPGTGSKSAVGNGFTFTRYDTVSMLIAIVRALETSKHKAVWKQLIAACLSEANSWIIPTKKYLDLYVTTAKLKKKADKKKN